MLSLFKTTRSPYIPDLLASYDVPAQLVAIENLIAQGVDMQVVLRLICLASLTGGGIKAKALDNLKREVLQVLSFLLLGICNSDVYETLLQAYGYHLLPLLLSLASPPLGILLPNPLPASAPATLTASKYPYTTLRKSLRLLIDDNPDSLVEVENDISFVYSGYAPISVRLVQCVAQKGGVLSNPATNLKLDKGAHDDATRTQSENASGRVQAHPIVGWKGFEDVMSALPGETIDVVQKGIGGAETTAHSLVSMRECYTRMCAFYN